MQGATTHKAQRREADGASLYGILMWLKYGLLLLFNTQSVVVPLHCIMNVFFYKAHTCMHIFLYSACAVARRQL